MVTINHKLQIDEKAGAAVAVLGQLLTSYLDEARNLNLNLKGVREDLQGIRAGLADLYDLQRNKRHIYNTPESTD